MAVEAHWDNDCYVCLSQFFLAYYVVIGDEREARKFDALRVARGIPSIWD